MIFRVPSVLAIEQIFIEIVIHVMQSNIYYTETSLIATFINQVKPVFVCRSWKNRTQTEVIGEENRTSPGSEAGCKAKEKIEILQLHESQLQNLDLDCKIRLQSQNLQIW